MSFPYHLTQVSRLATRFTWQGSLKRTLPSTPMMIGNIHLQNDDPYQIHSDLKNKQFTIDHITRHDTIILLTIAITALLVLIIAIYTIFKLYTYCKRTQTLTITDSGIQVANQSTIQPTSLHLTRDRHHERYNPVTSKKLKPLKEEPEQEVEVDKTVDKLADCLVKLI